MAMHTNTTPDCINLCPLTDEELDEPDPLIGEGLATLNAVPAVFETVTQGGQRRAPVTAPDDDDDEPAPLTARHRAELKAVIAGARRDRCGCAIHHHH